MGIPADELKLYGSKEAAASAFMKADEIDDKTPPEMINYGEEGLEDDQ